jgi:hypothetical protein
MANNINRHDEEIAEDRRRRQQFGRVFQWFRQIRAGLSMCVSCRTAKARILRSGSSANPRPLCRSCARIDDVDRQIQDQRRRFTAMKLGRNVGGRV